MAAPKAAASSSEARYQRNAALCYRRQHLADKDDCLSEASTARAGREPVTVDPDPGRYLRNALKRCEPLAEPDRGDCVARMQGQGTTSGSVAGGGIYRGLVTRDAGPASQADKALPAAPTAPAK